MAEFAAAASGGGLASLEVQCCKGLAEYYSSYKSCDQQIEATYKEIEILTNIFGVLERALSQHYTDQAQEATIKQIESNLTACQERVGILQTYLESCRNVGATSDSSVQLQRVKTPALFPFREKTLRLLRENVQSLRDDLQLALETLQLYVSIMLCPAPCSL